MSSNMMLAISLAMSVTFGAFMPSSVSNIEFQQELNSVEMVADVSNNETTSEAVLPWWTCVILDQNISGGVIVAGNGIDASGSFFYQYCYETEGNAPGGKPTGDFTLTKIRLSAAK